MERTRRLLREAWDTNHRWAQDEAERKVQAAELKDALDNPEAREELVGVQAAMSSPSDGRLARLTRTTEGFIEVLDTEIKMARSRGEDGRFAQALFTATASTLDEGSQAQKCARVAKWTEKALWTAYALWVIVELMHLAFAGLALKYAAAIGRAARQTTQYERFEGTVTVASCTGP